MVDERIREVLKRGMLNAARLAAKELDFEEALENVVALLAVDPEHVGASVALMEMAIALLDTGRGRRGRFGKQKSLLVSGKIRLDATYALNADEKRYLLKWANDVKSGGRFDDDARIRILTKIDDQLTSVERKERGGVTHRGREDGRSRQVRANKDD